MPKNQTDLFAEQDSLYAHLGLFSLSGVPVNRPVMPSSLCHLLKINIVMSSSLFILITYYSVVTDTNEHD